MGHRSLAVIVAASLTCALSAVHAEAAVIGVFNTGVGIPGTVDPHYTVVISADPSFPPPNAIITTTLHELYFPNTATSRWISLVPDTTIDLAGGTYEYRTTFDLTGMDPATAFLSGLWSSDNEATIYINGVATANALPGAAFLTLTPFAINSGFVAGINTLDFVVLNYGGPSALRVEFSGVGAGLPEPASLALLTIGGASLLMRKRRKTA